jgi:hypothetical protein
MTVFTHGKKTSFKLDNSGGTLQDLSTYLTDVNFPETIDTVDSTTFGANSKSHAVGLMGGTIALTGHLDPTLDVNLSGVKGQDASISFEYGPQGTGTGMPKYTGECFLTGYDKGSGIGALAKITANLLVTGDVIKSAY